MIVTHPHSTGGWIFTLLLAAILIVYSALLWRLISIEIDILKEEVTLTKSNLFKSKRAKTYPLSDLQFTFKPGKPGFRDRIVNICKLYIEGKEIAAIIPDHDGWTDDTVNDLAKGLVNLGVAKKFIGYSKDAEIYGL
ncbi:MAG: hypothetical protein WBP45_15220 [Daejeonella sp.]